MHLTLELCSSSGSIIFVHGIILQKSAKVMIWHYATIGTFRFSDLWSQVQQLVLFAHVNKSANKWFWLIYSRFMYYRDTFVESFFLSVFPWTTQFHNRRAILLQSLWWILFQYIINNILYKECISIVPSRWFSFVLLSIYNWLIVVWKVEPWFSHARQTTTEIYLQGFFKLFG